MAIELECKVPIPDRATLAARLAALGAEAGASGHERNWVFDTAHVIEARAGMLLRLRTMEGELGGTLTVKYKEESVRFKSRREIELGVEPADCVPDVLGLMGFRVEWFYEKLREHWRYRGCAIALDELPLLGCFIEVEGPDEEAIDAILAELGLDEGRHVEESYFGLFRRYCAERDMPFGNLCFDGPPPIEAPAP